MYDFSQNTEQKGLVPWPSLVEEGAKILEGDPQQSGRCDFGSLETAMISGVWECTKGKFEVEYLYNEMPTILKGRVALTDSSGVRREYGPGDTHFVAKGENIHWDILTDKIKKTFFLSFNDQSDNAFGA